MDKEPPVRVALRVEDVAAASRLYEEFGFVRVGEVPGPDGRVLMAILRRGPVQLLVDALEGIPFPETERERLTKAGPRGLGVVVGLEVSDVDAMARICEAAHPAVDGDALVHRQNLVAIMTEAGFVNYPTEWWHWSYGDRYWAWATGEGRALFATV